MNNTNRNTNKIKGALATLCVMAFTVYSWSEQPTLTTPSETNTMSTVTNSTSGLVIVAYGKLVGIDNSRLRPNDPIESQTDMATYTISEVVRGTLNSNQVRVIYSTISARSPLPENAILLLFRYSVSAVVYAPLGREAWRGILPDTPENRARIQAIPSEELSKTPPGMELPETAARQIAQQALADRSDYTGYSGKFKFSTIKRMPFGWFFGVEIFNERGSKPFVSKFTVHINDEGEVVTCYCLPFGSHKSAAQW